MARESPGDVRPPGEVAAAGSPASSLALVGVARYHLIAYPAHPIARKKQSTHGSHAVPPVLPRPSSILPLSRNSLTRSLRLVGPFTATSSLGWFMTASHPPRGGKVTGSGPIRNSLEPLAASRKPPVAA